MFNTLSKAEVFSALPEEQNTRTQNKKECKKEKINY